MCGMYDVCMNGCVNIMAENHNTKCLVFAAFSGTRRNYVVLRLSLRVRPRHGHHVPRRLSSSVTSSSTPGGPPSPSTLAKET
jgi:hypothetical protein